MRRRQLLGIVAFATGFAAVQGHAADGVLEINQTCATQTGCFAGDTAGVPVTITGTAGLSYRLTSDLLVLDANTDVISISASGVSVDLGGFRIQGPNTCSGTPTVCALTGSGDGVSVTNPATITGVEVARGSIVGMGRRGVDLGDASAVRDLRASENREVGISVLVDGVVSGSVASRNGGNGINTSSGASVTGCTASTNGSIGIVTAIGSSVTGSTARANGSAGFDVSSGSTVTGCSAVENFDGIDGGLGSIVSSSSALSNRRDGISTSGGSTISNNSSMLNGGDGIQTGSGSFVIGNGVRDNTGPGLHIAADSAYRENVITSNTAGTVTINGSGAFVNLGDNFCTDAANATVACP